MKNLLLISSGLFHPSWLGRLALRRWLESALAGSGWNGIVRRPSPESLPALVNQVEFAAIVLYVHQKAISSQALDALDSFISRGGGLLALHSAAASYKANHQYRAILGGRFTGHAPMSWLDVEPAAGDNAPFDGLPAFRIRDELYIHELQPDVRIHFWVENRGRQEPLVWTRRHGAGRVCYLCPGHTASSLTHPAVQAVLQRGLDWVSAGRANG